MLVLPLHPPMVLTYHVFKTVLVEFSVKAHP